jgi:hypothetical protein
MRKRNGLLLTLALAAALAAGCGKTAAVKGRVTLDGKPVSAATVLFVPEDSEAGRPASGMTDGDGYFHLTTYRPDDGALPGAYRLVVSKTTGVATPPDSNHASKKRALEYRARTAAREHGQRLLPARYGDPATTPLRCTVPASDLVNVELSSKAAR